MPWACLMKGCSRRWVTDGRASKSLIRHLKIKGNKTQLGRGTFKEEELFSIPMKFVLKGSPNHCRSCLDQLCTRVEPGASVLKSGALVCVGATCSYHYAPPPPTPTPTARLDKLGEGTAVNPLTDVQCLPTEDVIKATNRNSALLQLRLIVVG